MGTTLDPEAEVMVETKIRYSGLHGSHFTPLGTDLLKSGQSKTKTAMAVLPLFYSAVTANAFHPAHYIDSTSSKKTPFALLDRSTANPATPQLGEFAENR